MKNMHEGIICLLRDYNKKVHVIFCSNCASMSATGQYPVARMRDNFIWLDSSIFR